ncbi:DoxX family membrane protein [Trueperella pecoris]|uniref:DoxX family membrane protein n=1 Tax=Trueperella pecoris TaxID=2733571 RepID=A0A7M1QVK3_9ACTO|nr:DoxX family membrane protein [Trueperella pecoris]QOQ39278.1 DoxX family membrane protein [Trueperella pecoris]QOR46080.1 DoxX family membrane protein [Trueperella pecoris]QTG75912.1 DoxX family membrane protein [Trueperella pecoris]
MISTLARPLLAAPFIAAGVDALRHPANHRAAAERVLTLARKAGVPALDTMSIDALTRATGAVFTVAGLSLARGRMPRSTALMLGAMQIPLSLGRNPFWAQKGATRRESLSALVADAGLIGGALIASTDRGGKPSLGWRASAWAKEVGETASEHLPIGDGR